MKEVVAETTRCQNGTTRACLAVIAFLYLATVGNVIVPHLGYSVHGASHLLILSALTAAATTCYLQCVYRDPGRVPPGWQPDPEQQASAGVLQVKRRGGGRRFCKKCGAFKPPRAHHCRRCGRCVLRMDHHCIWVNNCIGHGNYRAFLLMCAYLAAACLHTLGLLLQLDAHLAQVALGWDERSRLAAAAGGPAAARQLPGGAADASPSPGGGIGSRVGWGGPFWVHAAVQVLATACALPVCVGLGVLLVWNTFLFVRNQTTIEYHEGVVAQLLAPASGGAAPARHPFDLGWEGNAAAVCGDDVACWPLPGRAAAAGDGLHFASPFSGGQSSGAGGPQGGRPQ